MRQNAGVKLCTGYGILKNESFKRRKEYTNESDFDELGAGGDRPVFAGDRDGRLCLYLGADPD